MILESVENGPILWPTVEENGVTRLKKYSELSTTESIQADCDVKSTNIILQGLPPEVYALVSTHKVAKELWKRIQMLMQGTSLTKQERECKLYDEFDKFAYMKGESLRDFYLRFSLLLNDMNIYNMKLEQLQVNTKFLNTFPPEWSKFVTDVKLVRDMHITNVDQLHANLGQHEYHANEVRLMHERTSDPLALVAHHQINNLTYQQHQQSYHQHQFQPQASTYQSSQYATPYHPPQYASQAPSSTPLSLTYPLNDFQLSVNHSVYYPSSSMPHVEYAPAVHPQSEFFPPDIGLVVLVFQKGNDPIDAINHMMSFLTSVVTSRKQRVIVCYNCKGEGHLSKQCIKPKKKRDEQWFKDKVLLVQAQANGQVLQEEELEFLADPRIAETSTLKETLSKLKGKAIVTEAVTLHPIDPELLKIDVAPLAPKLRNNRTAHTDYLRHTQEETATLREIVESERLLNPLNTSLDYARKYTKRIQELLTILQQTCPCITDLGTKLIAVTPKNNDKNIKLTEHITLSGNTPAKTTSSTNVVSNTPVPSSTGVNFLSSASGSQPQGVNFLSSASGSQPQGNTKNDRIQRAPSKAKKNKLEDHHRTVRPSLNKKKSVVDTKSISSVTNSKLNVNVDLKCATCNGCLFFDNHGSCVLAYINYVNASLKSKSVPKPKFLGTVKFGNDHVAKIMGYGDYKIGNVKILRVYFVEGLGHNLFSVGQFFDSDLEVAVRQHTCFIRNLDGVDLLTGIKEGKSWLWHRHLSHLNSGAINHLARQGLVRGLPKLKFEKDHLCLACAMGKCTKKSHKPKSEDTNLEKLYLLQMNLCGPMRTESNDVVERHNRTLIEAARTMLIYAQASLFLWAEAMATACYTQNRSIIRLRHGKTPYELLHNKLPDLSFLYVFGALCYPTNDSENLGKLQPKADIGIFISYAPTKKAFQIYNRRTRQIVETIHIDFDELTTMASEQSSSGPALNEMTSATIIQADLTGSPFSTTVDQDAPLSKSHTTPKTQSSVIPQDVEEDNINIEVAHIGNDPLFGVPIPEVTSAQSSSTASPHQIVQPGHQIPQHTSKWTKDHPLNNIIGQLSRPVSTRLQLYEQALFCYYDAFLSSVEPKTYKDALTQSCWIELMQEELNELE
nr:hypothetical protein [Tanacetum cinerariifolium]